MKSIRFRDVLGMILPLFVPLVRRCYIYLPCKRKTMQLTRNCLKMTVIALTGVTLLQIVLFSAMVYQNKLVLWKLPLQLTSDESERAVPQLLGDKRPTNSEQKPLVEELKERETVLSLDGVQEYQGGRWVRIRDKDSHHVHNNQGTKGKLESPVGVNKTVKYTVTKEKWKPHSKNQIKTEKQSNKFVSRKYVWFTNPKIQNLKSPIFHVNPSNTHYMNHTKKYEPVIGLDDYIPNGGKSFVVDKSLKLTPEYRSALKELGFEPAEEHTFYSPYISTPRIYPKHPPKQSIGSSTPQKKKLISCYLCPGRFGGSIVNKYNNDFLRCPYSQCELDLEGKRMAEADVLLVFIGDVGNRPPPPRPPGQIWVMLYWESPIHTPYPRPYELWKDKFNWTMNYRLESDIFYPYERLAWRARETLLSDQEYYSIARNKTKSAAWWVSHCPTESKRMAYVKEMQKYIDVDIYGKCGPLECEQKQLRSCEDMLTTTYRFYLSFENSMCTDYATEKFFRSFVYRSHIVPVVRSGFNYEKYVPRGMYVNAAHFKTAKDLALHLKWLESDMDAYVKILKEKDKLRGLNRKFDWCDVCEKLHTNTEKKVIPDIKDWSYKEACQHPDDVSDIV